MTKVTHRRHGELRAGRYYSDIGYVPESNRPFDAADGSLIVIVSHPMIVHGEIKAGEFA